MLENNIKFEELSKHTTLLVWNNREILTLIS